MVVLQSYYTIYTRNLQENIHELRLQSYFQLGRVDNTNKTSDNKLLSFDFCAYWEPAENLDGSQMDTDYFCTDNWYENCL